MKSISHAVRRLILAGIIIFNTILLAVNLLLSGDVKSAVVNFLTACICWIGIYFVNLSEQVELSIRKKDPGEEHVDE